MAFSKAAANPRATLFAASLAKDVAQIATNVEGECATLRLASERFYGLPSRTDVGGVADIARDLGKASLNLETQMRKLRAVLDELRDFVR
jgi:hypothetical protein